MGCFQIRVKKCPRANPYKIHSNPEKGKAQAQHIIVSYSLVPKMRQAYAHKTLEQQLPALDPLQDGAFCDVSLLSADGPSFDAHAARGPGDGGNVGV